MAGFRGYRSDLSDTVVQPEDHVRLRMTAKGQDGVLHEAQIDIAWSELESVLPTLHDGSTLDLKVYGKRGRRPGTKVAKNATKSAPAAAASVEVATAEAAASTLGDAPQPPRINPSFATQG